MTSVTHREGDYAILMMMCATADDGERYGR